MKLFDIKNSTDNIVDIATIKTQELRDKHFEEFKRDQLAELEALNKEEEEQEVIKEKNLLFVAFPDAILAENRERFYDLDEEKAGLRGRRKLLKKGINPDKKLVEIIIEKPIKIIHREVEIEVVPEGITGKKWEQIKEGV